MNLNPYFLKPEATLKEAFNTIENTYGHIAIILDENNKLIGLVTDGDIRRGLLNGLDLNSEITNVMTKNMIYLKSDINSLKSTAISLMNKHDIKQIPVLNTKGEVINLFLMKDFNNNILNEFPTVVIMAGGLGSRLLPLTEKTPKPMLKVGGKPLLEIVLSQCISAGLKNYYFAVNHLKEKIIEYFGDGSKWGVSINYLKETKPLGTAGALQLLPNKIETPLLVLNGDVLTNLNIINLIDFHTKHGASGTICVREHIETIPYGVISLNGEEVLGIKEKPSFRHYVNAGVYVLNPEIIKLIKKEMKMDMPELINLAKENFTKVIAYPIHEYWLDIGLPETFNQAKQEWDKNIFEKKFII